MFLKDMIFDKNARIGERGIALTGCRKNMGFKTEMFVLFYIIIMNLFDKLHVSNAYVLHT